jgi:hypothetical protein
MKLDDARADRLSDGITATPQVFVREVTDSNLDHVFGYHNCGHDHLFEMLT